MPNPATTDGQPVDPAQVMTDAMRAGAPPRRQPSPSKPLSEDDHDA